LSTLPPDSSSPNSNEPEAPHRGMIPRAELDFLPKINWRFWAPIAVVIVGFIAVREIIRRRDLEQRRTALLLQHSALTGSLSPAYQRMRERIEAAILQSVGPWQGNLREPGFTRDALGDDNILYARTRLGEIHDRADIAVSVRHRYADQLNACLGVQHAWAREFLDKGAFLLPSHVDLVRGADTPERIAALRVDLTSRMQRDGTFLDQATRRRYFLLAVDEAPLSIEGPTRVYVYDLNDGRPLLRVRGQGDDVILVPFRIAGVPAPAANAPRSRAPTVSQHDCSVANAVRGALGIEPLGLMHVPDPPPVEPTDATTASDASTDTR
jgi:hypothetical protein